MREGARIGLEHEHTCMVTRDLCVLADRTPPVFATAEMVKIMELAAYRVLEPFYERLESSVGTRIEVRHLAPTPPGMRVRAVARLVRIEGQRYSFEVAAYDEKEPIGQGTHDRFVVDLKRFRRRLASKSRVETDLKGDLRCDRGK